MFLKAGVQKHCKIQYKMSFKTQGKPAGNQSHGTSSGPTEQPGAETGSAENAHGEGDASNGAEKNAVSHRGRALERLAGCLRLLTSAGN